MPHCIGDVYVRTAWLAAGRQSMPFTVCYREDVVCNAPRCIRSTVHPVNALNVISVGAATV